MIEAIDAGRNVVKSSTMLSANAKCLTKGRIYNPGRLITAKIDMEDVVMKRFEALLNNKSENIKILIGPTRMNASPPHG